MVSIFKHNLDVDEVFNLDERSFFKYAIQSGKVTTSAGRNVKVYNFLLLLCVSVTSSTGGVTSL